MTDSTCIVVHTYLADKERTPKIGGVQTYIDGLCKVLTACGSRVYVLQESCDRYNREVAPNVHVIGVGGSRNILKAAYLRKHRNRYSRTIFAYFDTAVWSSGELCIAVQHGVATDGFSTRHRGVCARAHRWFWSYERWKERRNTAAILDKVDAVICVDTNFQNWLRSNFPFRRWENKLHYVPNFGDPVSQEDLKKKMARTTRQCTILIPRRFEAFRGVLMMASIVRDIRKHYPEAHFHFAGVGSQESDLRRLLFGIPNCTISAIEHERVREAYMAADIVVIPSLWSEGTSLACIEGMCTGNAVLVTNVGGLSNLILDGYNGLMAQATADSVRAGLIRLMENGDLRRQLAETAYRMASLCFSRERWQEEVRRIVFSVHRDSVGSSGIPW